MRRFILEQSDSEFYTSHSGLALIGLCLNRFTTLAKALRTAIPLRHGIPHSDIIKSYVGLLCLGKSDFEAVENVRKDRFFKESLDISHVPSSARLRQRLDEYAKALLPIMYAVVIEFLVKAKVPVTPLPLSKEFVALDIDVFPMDNSGHPQRGCFEDLQGGGTAMHRLRPIWARKGGAWRVNCARGSSIVRRNSSTPWSGYCRTLAS